MSTAIKKLVMTLALGATMITIAQSADAQYIGEDSHQSKMIQTPAIAREAFDSSAEHSTRNVGTVMVMTLSNFETVLNLSSNAAEIIGISWGSVLLLSAAIRVRKSGAKQTFAIGFAAIILGLCTPSSIAWIGEACRDANLFS